MVRVAHADAKPPVKRSLARRIARVAVRFFASFVALVVIGIAFLHTRWGKELVRARVEATLGASIDGTVTLGSVDYGFLFDGVDLGALDIRRDGKPALSIAALHVDLDRRSLLAGAPVIDKLDISGLAVAIVQAPDGRTNLTGLARPSDRAPLASIRVAALSVTGSASLTQADGASIVVSDLAIAGSLDARPAANEVDAVLDRVAAKLAITRPGGVTTRADLAIGHVQLGRRADAVDLDVRAIVLGALSIDNVRGQVALADGRLAGAQAVAITGARVDHTKLATELGRTLLVGDAKLDVTVSGPVAALAIAGDVATGGTSFTLSGTVDASAPARPRYQLALAGKGASADVVPAGTVASNGKPIPAIETSVRVTVDGAGVTLADVDAELGLEIGPTQIGAIAVAGLSAKVHANRGAYTLESLAAHGLGFEVGATGDIAGDTTLHGRLTVAGSPAEAMTVLHAAGIEIPRKVPRLARLELAVTAAGKLDGQLDVAVEPTRIAIAGGGVAIAGKARIDHRVIGDASTTLALRGLDLRQLASLAGKPPPAVDGSLSGTVALTRTGAARLVDYDLAIALRAPAIAVLARGHADGHVASAHARIVRGGDRAVLATLEADVPIDDQGLVPARGWHVALELARRPLAELTTLLPQRLPPLPPDLALGDVELHADLRGTPSQPRGTIDARVTASLPELGAAHVDLHGALAPDAHGGVAVATTGTIAADAMTPELATITGTLALPQLFVGRVVDPRRLRAGLSGTATIALPERELASLPRVPPALAALGGVVGGHITVRHAAPGGSIDAQLAWHGYKLADGGEGATTIAVAGTPDRLAATITHAGALTIAADVARSGDRIAVQAHVHAPETSLLALAPALPQLTAEALHGADIGKLRADLDGNFALVRDARGIAIDRAAVTGGLAIHGGAFAIPNSERRWHDIGLELAGDPHGVRLVTLDVHESDAQVPDRHLHASGLVALAGVGALDPLKPQTVSVSLSARDWLALGLRSPLLGDAPTATVDLDARVAADLTAPIIAVDATIDHLDFRAPDRHDRAHQPEVSSIAGDVIFVDGSAAAVGKLPVPPPPSAPAVLPPIDVRVHIPGPIHALKAPLEITARGDLAITVRDGVVQTRGDLTLPSGTITLFGHSHDLVDGHIRFTAEHPHGDVALTFTRHLPDWSNRDLSRPERGVQLRLTGDPTKPTIAISGVSNAKLPEVFAMNFAGRPQFVAAPGLPASATVEVPRGDQLNILAYLSLVIPHFLFLNHVSAWSDASEPRGAYGRVRNVQAERYVHGERTRIRAVARPTQPGRSTAELQWDHLWLHDDHAAVGGGVRAGDRAGGGVGVFFEWSSVE